VLPSMRVCEVVWELDSAMKEEQWSLVWSGGVGWGGVGEEEFDLDTRLVGLRVRCL
jgi:hypothetical protein